MKYIRSRSSFLIFALAFSNAGCGTSEVANNSQPVSRQLFPPDAACVYPVHAPGKVFSKLGGGSWAATDPADPRSSFECSGSNSPVQIYIGEQSAVDVEYSLTGVEDGATMITLSYRAIGGPVPNESTYRNTFANLADVVSRHSLNNPLPELARRKLGNLKSYSQTGTDNTENFDVGQGFISLSRNMSADGKSITATVRFFSDVGFKLEQ
jgi:hypothetical protein